MTHDELLGKLLISDETKLWETLTQWQKALNAIVELHKPDLATVTEFCWSCGDTYPCPTIKAVEKELL